MNLTSPILTGAAHVADLPGDCVASLLKTIADCTGLFADDSPDGVTRHADVGAGRRRHRARGRHRADRLFPQPATAAGAISSGTALPPPLVLGLLAFVAYDMRHAALAYLGINPTKPAVEFEIRLPKAAVSALADSQVELHTDRNQTLARDAERAGVRRRRPQRAQGFGAAGLPHQATAS